MASHTTHRFPKDCKSIHDSIHRPKAPCMGTVASTVVQEATIQSGKRLQEKKCQSQEDKKPGPSAVVVRHVGDGSLRGTWPMRMEMFGRDRGDGVAGVCLGRRMNWSWFFDCKGLDTFFGVVGGAVDGGRARVGTF